MHYTHNWQHADEHGEVPLIIERREYDTHPSDFELARDWHETRQDELNSADAYWADAESGQLDKPVREEHLVRGDYQPGKFDNPDATGVNPEWRAWRDRQREAVLDSAGLMIASTGSLIDTYMPERDGKLIPPEGAWIIVLEEPSTVLQSRFRLPPVSLWRARPHTLEVGGVRVEGHGVSAEHFPHQAVIVTPGGDLHLWPHEYVIVPDPARLVGLPGTELHSLGGQPVLDEDHLFYLMSRGVPRHEATLLLFDTITEQNYLYATFSDEVAARLSAGTESLTLHVRRGRSLARA